MTNTTRKTGAELEMNVVIVDRNGKRYRIVKLIPGPSIDTIKGLVRNEKGESKPFTFKCSTAFNVEVC